MELYEEVVGDVNCPTPNNSRASIPRTLAYSSSRRLAFEGPIVECRRSENADFYSSERSELAPQPALRYKLAGQDSRAAVVTDRDGFATLSQNWSLLWLTLTTCSLGIKVPLFTANKSICLGSVLEVTGITSHREVCAFQGRWRSSVIGDIVVYTMHFRWNLCCYGCTQKSS